MIFFLLVLLENAPQNQLQIVLEFTYDNLLANSSMNDETKQSSKEQAFMIFAGIIVGIIIAVSWVYTFHTAMFQNISYESAPLGYWIWYEQACRLLGGDVRYIDNSGSGLAFNQILNSSGSVSQLSKTGCFMPTNFDGDEFYSLSSRAVYNYSQLRMKNKSPHQ